MNFKDDFAIVAEAVKKQGNAMHHSSHRANNYRELVFKFL